MMMWGWYSKVSSIMKYFRVAIIANRGVADAGAYKLETLEFSNEESKIEEFVGE